ncbi:hypothetical protein ACFLUG_04395 [Chloroflexota bacterium]
MRKYIPAIASFLIGNGLAGLIAWFGQTIIALVISGTFTLTGMGLAIAHYISNKRKITRENEGYNKNDGLVLLLLLDEVYRRQKEITRQTIRRMRQKDWQGMEAVTFELMGLAEMDIDVAIWTILQKNVTQFMSGKPLTVVRDSRHLSKKIHDSPLFTRNPEHIAKDASVILREKVPYLKKMMEHDRKYKSLNKQISRERDKFPSDSVSDAIDTYLDHSIKINAAWVMSENDLDFLDDFESATGTRVSMRFKVILMGLPGRMDEEMTEYRNKVAIAIFDHIKEI